MMMLLMTIIVVVMMMVMITQIGHRRATCHEDFKGHVDAALWKSFIDNLTDTNKNTCNNSDKSMYQLGEIHATILTNPSYNLERSI